MQNLRDDAATAIRNRKKIKELIEKKPEIHLKYYWSIVCHEAKAQSETFFIHSLVEKVRYNLRQQLNFEYNGSQIFFYKIANMHT